MLAELIALATQPISDADADCTTFGTGIAKLPSPDENNESSTSTDSLVPGRKEKNNLLQVLIKKATKVTDLHVLRKRINQVGQTLVMLSNQVLVKLCVRNMNQRQQK